MKKIKTVVESTVEKVSLYSNVVSIRFQLKKSNYKIKENAQVAKEKLEEKIPGIGEQTSKVFFYLFNKGKI